MAGNDPARAVLDAGPLIHLDELGCLELLEGFAELGVPHTVWQEVRRHRPQLAWPAGAFKLWETPIQPTPALVALARSFGLDAGEYAALSLLEAGHGDLMLCDDAAARLAAESLGFKVHGTVGLIVRAIRRGTRTVAEVKTLLEQVPMRSTLHISRSLLAEIIEALPSRS
jgi:predicted nucleic acid-binding protein